MAFFAKTTPLSYKIGFCALAVAACLWTSSATLMRFGVDLEPVAGPIAYLLFAALFVAVFSLTWTIANYVRHRRAARAGQPR